MRLQVELWASIKRAAPWGGTARSEGEHGLLSGATIWIMVENSAGREEG